MQTHAGPALAADVSEFMWALLMLIGGLVFSWCPPCPLAFTLFLPPPVSSLRGEIWRRHHSGLSVHSLSLCTSSGCGSCLFPSAAEETPPRMICLAWVACLKLGNTIKIFSLLIRIFYHYLCDTEFTGNAVTFSELREYQVYLFCRLQWRCSVS